MGLKFKKILIRNIKNIKKDLLYLVHQVLVKQLLLKIKLLKKKNGSIKMNYSMI